jgi:hypothetical protein
LRLSNVDGGKSVRRGGMKNRVEAGRWGFLAEDVQPSELAAFARAHRTARARLRVLGPGADPSRGLGTRRNSVVLLAAVIELVFWVSRPVPPPAAGLTAF